MHFCQVFFLKKTVFKAKGPIRPIGDDVPLHLDCITKQDGVAKKALVLKRLCRLLTFFRLFIKLVYTVIYEESMGFFDEKISPEDLFFDNHLHIMTLSHICISAYIAFCNNNKLSEAAAVASSPDYIYKDVLTNFDQTLAPLSIIEGDERRIIQILRDDICGKFEDTSIAPIFYNDEFHLGDRTFKKMVITPLLMDFDYPYIQQQNSYKLVPPHSVDKQAAALIEAIKDYYTSDKDSLFLIRPYVGIHPENYTMDEITVFLHRYFSNWSGTAHDGLKAAKRLSSFKVTEMCVYPNFFGGIKFYPPLGFDASPTNRHLKEKVNYIFGYCEKRKIPIITHCDDQGFRLLPMEKSHILTSPEHWESVLEKYPNLYLDFAHFGRQYYKKNPLKNKNSSQWMEKIIDLMIKYPNVYTDISFNAFESNFWGNIFTLAYSHSEKEQEIIRKKILFGTDWPLSLIKISTASEYIRRFDKLPLDNDFKYAIVNENPRNFGFR